MKIGVRTVGIVYLSSATVATIKVCERSGTSPAEQELSALRPCSAACTFDNSLEGLVHSRQGVSVLLLNVTGMCHG